MALPIVAVVGRPNVGKSSLFNAIARRRIAIVDPTAGVTRDRISTLVEYEGRYFELVDTGGMGIEDVDRLTAEVEAQISLAIAGATLLLMVVDVREGIMPLDELVVQRLRRQNVPILLVANKTDDEGMDHAAGGFYKLGLGDPLPVSAEHHRNLDRLRDKIIKMLPPAGADEERPADSDMHVAIVGKRNAGKSTFINSLAEEERVIVSEIPGTTRDSVDIRIEKDGMLYTIIDTAGIRKKSRQQKSDIEFYSRVRAEEAIRRADVVLLFIDAMVPVGSVDKHLGRFIQENRKPVVIVVNKWDLAAPLTTTGDFGEYLTEQLPGLEYAPISFISAIDSRNVEAALDVARTIFKQSHTRVTTGELNRALEYALKNSNPPSGKAGRFIRIYYATQVAVDPPTITMFVNNPSNVTTDYARFLVNRFREILPFSEVPIRLIFRRSAGEEAMETSPGRRSIRQSRPSEPRQTAQEEIQQRRAARAEAELHPEAEPGSEEVAPRREGTGGGKSFERQKFGAAGGGRSKGGRGSVKTGGRTTRKPTGAGKSGGGSSRAGGKSTGGKAGGRAGGKSAGGRAAGASGGRSSSTSAGPKSRTASSRKASARSGPPRGKGGPKSGPARGKSTGGKSGGRGR